MSIQKKTIQEHTISSMRSLYNKFEKWEKTYYITSIFDVSICDDDPDYPGMGVGMSFSIGMKMGKGAQWDEETIINQLSRDNCRTDYSAEDRNMEIDQQDIEMQYMGEIIKELSGDEPKNENV